MNMKRLIFLTATMLLLCSWQFAAAQSPTDKIYKKYNGADGFTTIQISSELFGLFADIDADDPEMKDMKEMMEQLQGIRILMYDLSDKGSDFKQYQDFREAIDKLDLEGYSELMIVKEGGQEVKFLVSKKGDRIGELLMLINEGEEAGFISITGDIDLNTVGKLSKSMNMKGMENLEKLEKKEGEE